MVSLSRPTSCHQSASVSALPPKVSQASPRSAANRIDFGPFAAMTNGTRVSTVAPRTGARAGAHVSGGVEPTLVVDVVAREQPVEQVGELVEAGDALFEREVLAHDSRVEVAAGADAQQQPAAGDVVEGEHLSHELHGVVVVG